jgi:hypothetical protein
MLNSWKQLSTAWQALILLLGLVTTVAGLTVAGLNFGTLPTRLDTHLKERESTDSLFTRELRELGRGVDSIQRAQVRTQCLVEVLLEERRLAQCALLRE